MIGTSQEAQYNAPPRVVTTDPDTGIYATTTGGLGAFSADLWATYKEKATNSAGPPAGKVWVEVEPYGFDIWVRFSRTATTGTLRENGMCIKDGVARKLYVDPQKDKFLDFYCSGGAVTVKWRVCGQISERQFHSQ